MDVPTPPGLAPLPEPYRALFRRAVEALANDPRVRAVWLGGSAARGVADAGSDLDLLVAVDDADAFLGSSAAWLDAIAPVVYARRGPGFVHAVTATCERFDVVAEDVADLARTPYRYRLAVHDPDGLAAVLPAPEPARGPDVARMTALAEEFLRQQAIFPAAVVARQDWLLGVVGAENHRTMLYELFVEANQPLPPMGVKQWSAKLTDEQRAVLTSLPVPRPERDDLVAAVRAGATAWRTHGRAALEAAGGTWPAELDAAVTAYWTRELPEETP
ncbi:MAG TPA: nucleotidyltransferase domain-containing protein [Frankiaceae bacterium]|nr:nucleotidyltransferase domain-containing protein [Frankiaceae bacterium]